MRHEHVGLDEEAAVVAPGEVEVAVLLGVGVPGLQGAQAVGAPVAVLAPARDKMASQILKSALGHRRFCEKYTKQFIRFHPTTCGTSSKPIEV